MHLLHRRGLNQWMLGLALVLGASSCCLAAAGKPVPLVVDEPQGANVSLGMTLWHMGHNAAMVSRFHDYLKQAGLTPEALLPQAALAPPSSTVRMLLEPERLTKDQLNGWEVDGDYITGGTGDSGPTVAIPLHVGRPGLYRLWVQYFATAGSRGVTSLKIYRSGREQDGPIQQFDELYDTSVEKSGLVWHDLLVDLPAGDYAIKLGYVLRMWQGSGNYDARRIDCLYLTSELWAEPPTREARQAMRNSAEPSGIQWTVTPALSPADLPTWKWWQVRPLSWEDADSNPKLFGWSQKFWASVIDELSKKEYTESAPPDYRVPERQVVYNEIWNIVANPVRAKRQIDLLTNDISRQSLNYHYVWHDAASNIEGLRADGIYKGTPYEKYGGWAGRPGDLAAGYGDGGGTVTTYVPVDKAGKYSMWVLSSPVNISYKAPWIGKVSVDGKEQFTYHHEGKIPKVWMKMGDVVVDKPGKVQVDFTLNGAGTGDTYRHIAALFLVDDPQIIPEGTIRPPWTKEMFRQRAAQAGAQPNDKFLAWVTDNPYRRLSQEIWADASTVGDAWPSKTGSAVKQARLVMAGETNRAVQIGLHNLGENPLKLKVEAGALTGKNGSFAKALTWRTVAFVPYAADRQSWTPFLLMRRRDVTVPPFNTAGVWLTVDTHGVPAGDYTAKVQLSNEGMTSQTVSLSVRVSAITPDPAKKMLIDGFTLPHEGEEYMRDFLGHGMTVLHDVISKTEMQKLGIKHIALHCWEVADVQPLLARVKASGLDYDDYTVMVRDEPAAATEETLKAYIDVAKAIRAADPKVRILFNPGETATLETFQVLAPYCDFWSPYVLHVWSDGWNNPEKRKIYQSKPWVWYSTPCYNDKTAQEPGIRSVASQPGNCKGVSFFAMNYPFRDEWDTAYEFVSDASVMGALESRHGPVSTIVWEQIREASQAVILAMMVRDRLGVKTFDEVTDPTLQKLIREGTGEELVLWLEKHPKVVLSG